MRGEQSIRGAILSRVQQLRDSLSFFGQQDLALQVDSLLESFSKGEGSRHDLQHLPGLLERYRGLGLRVRCSQEFSLEGLSLKSSRAAYEIASEALQNALKYSRGKRVSLKIRCHRSFLKLEIRNHSRFSPAPSSGLGLAQMRWRVRNCRGQMKFDNPTAGQARLRVRLPI